MESKPEKIIRLVFVGLMGFFGIMIVASSITKSNDWANWVIAAANVAMAGAALAAFKSANRFLSEFFAKEGFILAIEMVNKNLIELSVDSNKLLSTCGALVSTYNNSDQVAYRNVNTTLLLARFNNLKEVSNKNRNWLVNAERLSKQMLSYGVVAADSKKEHLIKMVESLDNCLKSVDAILSYIHPEIIDCQKRKQSGSNLSDLFLTKQYKNVMDNKKSLEKEWNIMVGSYQSFFEGKRHIKSLFTVNDKS